MGWQWHQLDHMQIICTSLQTDNHASTSSLNFYRPDALPDDQAAVSKHCTLCIQRSLSTRVYVLVCCVQLVISRDLCSCELFCCKVVLVMLTVAVGKKPESRNIHGLKVCGVLFLFVNALDVYLTDTVCSLKISRMISARIKFSDLTKSAVWFSDSDEGDRWCGSISNGGWWADGSREQQPVSTVWSILQFLFKVASFVWWWWWLWYWDNVYGAVIMESIHS